MLQCEIMLHIVRRQHFDGEVPAMFRAKGSTQIVQFKNLYPGAPSDETSQIEDFLGSYRPTVPAFDHDIYFTTMTPPGARVE
jgi:hypothetical protein